MTIITIKTDSMLILSNSVAEPSAYAQSIPRNKSASMMIGRRSSNIWKSEGITARMTAEEIGRFDNPSLSAKDVEQIIGQLVPAIAVYLPKFKEQLQVTASLMGSPEAFSKVMSRNGAMSEGFLVGAATLRWLISNRRSQHLYSDYGLLALMIREVGTYRFGPYSPTKSSPDDLGLLGLPNTPKDGAVGVTPTRYGVDLTFPRFKIVDGKKEANHAFTTGFGGRQPIWWTSNNQKAMFKSILASVRSTDLLPFGRATLSDLDKLYYSLSATPWWFQALIIACETHGRMKNVDPSAVAGTKKMVANPTVGQLWYGYYQLENQTLRPKLLSTEVMRREFNKIDNTFAYLGIPETFTSMMSKGLDGTSVQHKSVFFDLPWLDDLQWARCVAGISNADLAAYHIEETNRRSHKETGAAASVASLLNSTPSEGTLTPFLGSVSGSPSPLRHTIHLDAVLDDRVQTVKVTIPLSRQIKLY